MSRSAFPSPPRETHPAVADLALPPDWEPVRFEVERLAVPWCDAHGSGVVLPAHGVPYALHQGQLYELAQHLAVMFEASMVGQPRPWDDDPGRTPFHSASRRRPPAEGADGIRGRSRPSPARVRPTSGGESGA
jgi:hypothetical protein